METEIRIECTQNQVKDTIRIWHKRKRAGWFFRNRDEYDKSIIEIYHYDTKIANIIWCYENFDERIYFVIDKKLEQGYSMTDRRFIKFLLKNDYKTFKQWAGKVKKYGNQTK